MVTLRTLDITVRHGKMFNHKFETLELALNYVSEHLHRDKHDWMIVWDDMFVQRTLMRGYQSGIQLVEHVVDHNGVGKENQLF